MNVESEFEALRRQLADRDAISLASRIQALIAWGMLALFAGTAMVFSGAPAIIEHVSGPWARLALGGPEALGGLLIVLAATRSRTHRWAWGMTLTGAVLLALVSVGMSAAYVWTGFHSGFDWTMPGVPIDPSAARAYVPVLYFWIAILVLLHVISLARLRPPRW